MKKQAWEAFDGDFIGATGVDSIEGFASAIIDAGLEESILDGTEIATERPRQELISLVAAGLVEMGARCLRVPVATFKQEIWNYEPDPMAFDAKPGRGYVKVFGVNP